MICSSPVVLMVQITGRKPRVMELATQIKYYQFKVMQEKVTFYEDEKEDRRKDEAKDEDTVEVQAAAVESTDAAADVITALDGAVRAGVEVEGGVGATTFRRFHDGLGERRCKSCRGTVQVSKFQVTLQNRFQPLQDLHEDSSDDAGGVQISEVVEVKRRWRRSKMQLKASTAEVDFADFDADLEVEDVVQRVRRWPRRQVLRGGGGDEDAESESQVASQLGGSSSSMQIVEVSEEASQADAQVSQQLVEVPQVKRKRQMRLGAMFQWKDAEGSLSEAAVKVEVAKEKIQNKMSFAEKEAALKQMCEVEGEVYVKNGSRDRWGNLRSNKGGRPRKAAVDQTGVSAGFTSNRSVPGDKRRRNEVSAAAKVAMAELIEDFIDKFWQGRPDRTVQLRRQLQSELQRRWPGWSFPQLMQIVAQKDAARDRMQELQLGSVKTVRKLNRVGAQLKKSGTSESLGCRAPGGGRKNDFLRFWKMVKVWHSFQRMMSKHVDKSDVLHEFTDAVQRQIDAYAAKSKITKLSKLETAKMEIYQERLDKLAKSAGYRSSYVDRLIGWMGARLRTSSRYTSLTLKEEQVGWEVTCQGFDVQLHRAAFGDLVQLRPFIADAVKFIERRSSSCLIFSDQVPFWVKIGQPKMLYASWEVGAKMRADIKAQKAKEDKVIEDKMSLVVADLANEGVKQLRGIAKSGQEKYRCTIEARQGVLNYFAADADPIGVVFPSLLIVYGVHCRLSNISSKRCWLQDETIIVAGEKIVRKKGEKLPGGLMKEWTDLRDAQPELFTDIIVMQQPSAVADEIICTWGIEDMMTRCPQGVWQRDLLGASMTDVTKVAMKIGHFLPSWIAAGMTPVCQLTDTDIAHPLKGFARRAMEDLKEEMKAACHQAGAEQVKFTCSTYEILKIANEAHKGIVKRNQDTQLVLAGLRRNGLLSWRPDLSKGEMVRSSDQMWASKLTEGSHRYPSSWLEARYGWIDSGGVPIAPDWKRCVKPIGDTASVAVVGPETFQFEQSFFEDDQFTVTHKLQTAHLEVEIPVVELEFEDQTLVTDALKELLAADPKAARLQKVTNPHLAVKKSAKRRDKMTTRSKIKIALASFCEELHQGLEQDLKKNTRSELMRKLQPAGCHGTKKKAAKAKKKLKLKTFKKATADRFLECSVKVSPLEQASS